MGRGRPREGRVKYELRTCEVHGLTEFAEHVSNGGVTYVCMACRNAYNRQYQADVRDGVRIPKKIVKPKAKPKCETCHMELPAIKICDNCD